MRMRFSMKTEYGVRAVLELAGHSGRGALQSSEIARRQGIPGPFLDQVLMILRRAGFITSTRGLVRLSRCRVSSRSGGFRG